MISTKVNDDHPAPVPGATMVCHVVALPYPGRSHINALMTFCKTLSSRLNLKHDNLTILITFVLTEEWLGLIGSDPKPDNNIRFQTLPNVIPSEHVRANQLADFYEAVATKLEAPFEELLVDLDNDKVRLPPVRVIVSDSLLGWPVEVGGRRNIPVASFWPLSGCMFSVLYHFDRFKQNGHFPIKLSERGHELVDYIPGIRSTRLSDISENFFEKEDSKTMKIMLDAVSKVSQAQYFVSSSVYELESQLFDVLKPKFPFPIYPIGPLTTINDPQFHLESNNYIEWLDSQPQSSVLYISFGSFLSVSKTQLDEIVCGIRASGVRHVWVARENVSSIKNGCGEMGFVVPWCDQMRVLCHSSIGGFWTHCGWNSTMEAIYGGVPMLTFPIGGDQFHNSKQIVEDWKIGWKVKKKKKKIICEGTHHGDDDEMNLVRRDEICELVKIFMDQENNDRKVMGERMKQLQKLCQIAISKGGSSHTNIDAFINHILQPDKY
ncbi:hypothetical protein F8388_005332 [Cannabis sativa]|uniref:Uncharacterized protein n=1 Tax=Cannabis sativa TaxID=3483 RepID=A0A7J6FW79_CANSA|nr:hypothetical protein F8388_005332 [Cannabis sativa]KAF4374897.1 hypothetical protein G4B88_004648 [Cannabis sativa]